jgi:formate dehydrogenase gamma subunit
MIVFTVIDYLKHFRQIRRLEQVRRMSANEVTQHTFLMISFILLVLTGFALRFSDAWIFEKAFGWDGGFQVRGIVHRASAGFFLFASLWHLIYLGTRKGRQLVSDLLPGPQDMKDLVNTLRYNLGRRQERPRTGRFGYVEKMEYWALVWGSVVMIVSGLFLWFDNFAVQFVPKGFLDVMLVIHFYEAVLATLAIAIWHMYFAVFAPGVYPGNPSWLTGKMPRTMYEHEHHDDPEAPWRPEAEHRHRGRDFPAGELGTSGGPAD